MIAAEALVADEDGEKTCEAEGLVIANRFQVTPDRLRTDVDAKDRLRLMTYFYFTRQFALLPGWRRWVSTGSDLAGLTEIYGELAQQFFLVSRLERLEPYGPMVRFRKSIDPLEQCQQVARLAVRQNTGIMPEGLGKCGQPPGADESCRAIRLCLAGKFRR